jgi:hypothetical protein
VLEDGRFPGSQIRVLRRRLPELTPSRRAGFRSRPPGRAGRGSS